MLTKWLPNFILAVAVRFLLMNSEYQKVISERVEVSTALNSWKRVTEGVYLHNFGIDPYSGDLFHETPICLYVFDIIQRYFPWWAFCLLFVVADLITSLCLAYVGNSYANSQCSKKENKKEDVSQEKVNGTFTETDSALYVLMAYLFNPYIILNCVGFTTTVFSNLLHSIALVAMIRHSIFWSCISIALLTLQNLYPISLLVPIAIYICNDKSEKNVKSTIIIIIITFLSMFTLLLGICYYIMGSWSFIWNIFGFILLVPDLRPNIGLYWYFLTEMFEHFRSLFIASFQINVSLLYIVPLALRLRREPVLLAFSYLAIMTIFKSYPCVGDVGFYVSLLPFWMHLFQHMQQGFVIGCFILVCTGFAPIVWHQWIYARSANANFYFGVTLAFAVAQIFLLTDILFASVKYEFASRHNINKDISGSKAKLLLE
ncbi:phosphatidylinositol glycan anchor biosynthesis class U protein-like [Vespa mandarinia]|uniref:phosphatidylinositol glycan anchor biosynthesis class U protein-like n=1 Tax=Vespa mandarinia TaxID=7446 RepID=UPI00160971A1|nr:phosphatidylinositol glycan anchor biosynthesis class U protein-like [Vespa mandarinia]XP_035723259.1 phosphatidylinositol glycan anchor biosynthesis class U protein-like [Vespa mandarinia]